MSLARRFSEGSAAAGEIIDNYQNVKRQRERREVMDAKPVESEGFTAADDERVDAMARAVNPETGEPYYNVQGSGSGLQVRSNFAYAGADGQQIEPGGTVGIAPRRVSDFLGARTEGSFTPEQMDRMRYAKLADVEAQYDPVKGLQMRRENRNMEREDRRFEQEDYRFGREKKKGEREDRDFEADEAAKAASTEWWKKRLTGADGAQREATMDDFMAGTQYRAYQLFKAGRHDQAGAAMKDYMQGAASQIQLQTAQRNEALGKVAAAAANGDLGPMKEFYNRFIPDGAKVTDVQRDPKTGAISISRISDDGRKLAPTVLKDIGQTLSVLNTFNDPMALVKYTRDSFLEGLKEREVKTNERVADAKIMEAGATAGLRAKQGAALDRATSNEATLVDLRSQYAALTDEEKAGPEGRGLIQRFNLANIKAGAAVPLGAQPKAERPEFTQADVNKYAEQLVGQPDPAKPGVKMGPQRARAVALAEISGAAPAKTALDIALEKRAAAGAAPAAMPPAPAPKLDLRETVRRNGVQLGAPPAPPDWESVEPQQAPRGVVRW